MAAKSKQSDEPSFEEALEKLEKLVQAMEDGELPLAALVAKYEEGNTLLRICDRKLKEAELKIEKLKRDKEQTSFEVFDSDSKDLS